MQSNQAKGFNNLTLFFFLLLFSLGTQHFRIVPFQCFCWIIFTIQMIENDRIQLMAAMKWNRWWWPWERHNFILFPDEFSCYRNDINRKTLRSAKFIFFYIWNQWWLFFFIQLHTPTWIGHFSIMKMIKGVKLNDERKEKVKENISQNIFSSSLFYCCSFRLSLPQWGFQCNLTTKVMNMKDYLLMLITI